MQTTKAQIILRSLISTFVVRCLDSIIPLVSISEISSLHLASVAAEASLCLTCSQTPEDRFSRDEAHMAMEKEFQSRLCSLVKCSPQQNLK